MNFRSLLEAVAVSFRQSVQLVHYMRGDILTAQDIAIDILVSRNPRGIDRRVKILPVMRYLFSICPESTFV